MKKITVILTMICLLCTLFAGCGHAKKTTECYYCGETKMCEKLKLDRNSSFWVCEDDIETVSELIEMAKELSK